MARLTFIEQVIIGKFPKTLGHFTITSEHSDAYNCIAHAVREDHRWWEPFPSKPHSYWPQGVSRSARFSSLVAAMAQQGFIQCDTPDFEAGYDKIALYEDNDGLWTHAARLVEDGCWTSKLGNMEDISHDCFSVLEGHTETEYGTVRLFMKKPI